MFCGNAREEATGMAAGGLRTDLVRVHARLACRHQGGAGERGDFFRTFLCNTQDVCFHEA